MNEPDEDDPNYLAETSSSELRAEYESRVVELEVEIAKDWLEDRADDENGIHISHQYANSDGYYERTDLDVTIT